MYKTRLKRCFDFSLALFGLVLFAELFLVICILLLIVNRGHIFFVQMRPGKDGKIFKIIKFRTMNNKKDVDGRLLPDANRLSFIGKILRFSSLDELPQLINVLKGDMSLVGPRPLLVEYLPLYSSEQRRRHEVRPGITGWAQVNGRNSISWAEKFKLDVWYVDHVSLELDVKILALTLKKVLMRSGVNATVEISSEPFNGRN